MNRLRTIANVDFSEHRLLHEGRRLWYPDAIENQSKHVRTRLDTFIDEKTVRKLGLYDIEEVRATSIFESNTLINRLV